MDYEKDEKDMPDTPWIYRCKDCYHNGRCEFQDAVSPGKFTQEEIADTPACGFFRPKEGF